MRKTYQRLRNATTVLAYTSYWLAGFTVMGGFFVFLAYNNTIYLLVLAHLSAATMVVFGISLVMVLITKAYGDKITKQFMQALEEEKKWEEK